ncbi:5-methylthioadenosine/S-adenosylhomocysteine deaminase [Paenibacillus baekrokdamisoli]|uniref:5-methylthioadenosine/S-adenosylhomocysteine deaminase n=1 Tax=Paenibacillus baekrokdamisoli TaxID=1712516 RepID=A0A3G9IZW0_9BACL|nr:5'-deoxyadenosine deaminase [Paenibacillus baekrokdamisoli]MBB3067632.1 cytosine/adenosine deaminase-related metal-dependent hydrolase [Paenibacillus baekrokdamisoli]BBH19181.1 5-methylthioadenosine/S-adenosylhomocysteine deaminase [Paenibacillus baekrokdamisoli]
MSTTLLHKATIVTMNELDEILVGDVLLMDEKIVSVGKEIPEYEAETTVIEAKGKLLLPGFVQTHIHLCQTLFRGQADDMALMDWLRKRVWPLEAAHDEDSVYYSALLGIGELLCSGTTTILDMETVSHTDSAFQAMASSGIRAISGKVMMDAGGDVPLGLQEQTQHSVEESTRLLEKWNGYDGGRLGYAYCPRFVVSCSEQLLTEVRDLSAHYNVLVHTHAAENLEEIELVQSQRGMRNIVYLDHIGLTSPRLVLAHCIWLDEQEREILRRTGTKMTHCPGSNLKLASGIAMVPELMEQGVEVGIGADGAPCNNTLDMFQEMRLTALLHKVRCGPESMDARKVLRMATIGGARTLGLDHLIGSIEIGKKADLVLLDLNDFHTFPSYEADPYSRVVYAASRSNVDSVWVDGKRVVERGKVRTVDKRVVLKEADRSIARLLKRI